MTATVTALLVSHDGARWVPSTLRHLAAQTRLPDRTIAVDDASTDDTAQLLETALGAGSVVRRSSRGGFPAAVDAALSHLPAPGDDPAEEWVWILHDDSAPAPTALEHLLAAAAEHPEADVLGPKIREWPSLRRLLEVGVTFSATGRRETGLERGEYDQGQHDSARRVLAVNTAGMLVRRATLERLRFDPELTAAHADVDFGWRAARAGAHVRTAPDAVVFHAEASRSGRRDPDRGRAARRREERWAASYVLLANGSAALLPVLTLRLLFGGMLRAVALLLTRAPAEAWGELLALGGLARPRLLLVARRRRAAHARVARREVRALLAPWWMPYRHGLDDLAEILTAVGHEVVYRVRGRAGDRTVGWRAWVRSPGVAVVLLLALSALLAARGHLGAGRLAGGALLPAPESALDWWRTYLSTTHLVGVGSAQTAPAYLVPLAVLGSVLLGSAGLASGLTVFGAIPLAGAGAYRLLVRLTGLRGSAAWGALVYALLLPTTGALAQGRLGTLVAGALLPWLASSASGLFAGRSTGPLSGDPERSRRARWRVALWLAAVAAFSPLLGLAAVVAGGVVAVLLRVQPTSTAPSPPSAWGASLAPLGLPVLAAAALLVPWTVLAAPQYGLQALLDAGRPAAGLLGEGGAWALLAARPGRVGAAPDWIGLVTPVVALLALLRRRSRVAVTSAWAVALVGLAVAAAAGGLEVTYRGTGTDVALWTGGPMLLAHGAWVSAAALALPGVRHELSGRAFGLRQVVGLLAAAAALVAPAAGLAWWWHEGAGPILGQEGRSVLPVYLAERTQVDPAQGVLVLRGDARSGYEYEVLHAPARHIGDDLLVQDPAGDPRLSDALPGLVSAPDLTDVEALARVGVAFVLAPAPADPDLAAALDGTAGLARASAGDSEGAAWRLVTPAVGPRVNAGVLTWLRPLLLLVQLVVVVGVAVLAAPERARR